MESLQYGKLPCLCPRTGNERPIAVLGAKYVGASHGALADIFECIENILTRLGIYTMIQPTMAMTETMVEILVKLLAVLALATKQISQGRLTPSRSKSSGTLS